ncbi:MAG: glycosyltransferase family 1 protein [Archaeoglobus sp.]|nr:MAG: glycosyltransferase family 1 protein [Archaeoglobus sp.]
MKICQVCHRFPPHTGGIETHVYELSKRLAEEFDVEVLTTDLSGSLNSIEKIEGITVRRFKSYAPSEAYYFSPDLYRYLKRNSDRYDVVHAHNYHAFPALFAALAKRNKLIFTPHYHGKGGSTVRNLLLKPYRLFGLIIFKKADAVICVSNYERMLVRSDFGVDAVVIPNGVSLDKIRNISSFEFSNKLILYVGRIEKYKNIHIVVKSMKYLDDFQFYIAGKGSFERELRKLIGRLGLEDRVKLVGFIDEETKYRWLKTCSVFVNLSPVEAFGITVLEALACGSPAVVSNSGALKEFAEKFDCVFAVSSGISPKELAEVIRRAAEVKVRVELREYDWDSIAERVIDVYRSVF